MNLPIPEDVDRIEYYSQKAVFSGTICVTGLSLDESNRRLYPFHVKRLKEEFAKGISADSHPPMIVSVSEGDLMRSLPLIRSRKEFKGKIIVNDTLTNG